MTIELQSNLGWLKTEHRDLLREIAELRGWWESRDKRQAPNFGEMSRRVMDLHDRLSSHFAKEEEGQYLNIAAEMRPGLASNVAGLLADHQKFRMSLADLAENLARGDFRNGGWEKPWMELQAILTALAEHEIVENDVLAAAFADNYREDSGA